MCPGVWKKVEVIPILKNGKDPKRRESYRPASSKSVCVKVLERMIVEGRMTRVRVGNGMSKWKKLQEWLIKGEVSSQIVFLLYANDRKHSKVQHVGYSGFADYLAIWSSGPSVQSVKNKIQRALDKVNSWTKQNMIGLNP